MRLPLMSIPRFCITRTAFGCSGFGLLPADAASTAPSDIRTSSASAICERALFPVHRKSTRRRRRDRSLTRACRRRCRHEPQGGVQRRTAHLEQLAAPLQIDGVVAVTSIRGAVTTAHDSSAAELRQVVGHQVLPARRAARSARAPPGRCAPARAATATGLDARPAAGIGEDRPVWARRRLQPRAEASPAAAIASI